MRRRPRPDQIAAILRDFQADLDAGLNIGQACRKAGIGPTTYYRWKALQEDPVSDEQLRVSELETEVGRLKQLVAELALDRRMLQEALKKNKVGKLGWRQRSSSWLRNLAGSRRKRRCLRLVSRRLSNWARSRRQSSTYPVRSFSPSSGRSRVARLATTRTEPWTTKPDPPCCRPLARRSW